MINMCVGIYVKYSLFVSDFIETWIFLTDFLKILKYQISWKSIQWEQSCEMDGQTDTNIIITFGNFANTPKKNAMFVIICLVNFYEFSVGVLYRKLSSVSFWRTGCVSVVLKSTDGLLLAPSTFHDWFAWIQCRLSSCNDTKQLCLLWKSYQWKPYFTYEPYFGSNSVQEISTKVYWVTEFVQLDAVKALLCLGCKWLSFCTATFIVWCGGNLISAHFSVEHLWISWKPAQGKSYFSCGQQWSYIYVCTFKPYDIFKAKNVFGKPVLWWCVHHLHHVAV
jgi:hypothetical protein